MTMLDPMPTTWIASRTVRGLLSAVLRVMSELGILSFLMMFKTSTQDCTSCVFYTICTHCRYLGAGLPWSGVAISRHLHSVGDLVQIGLGGQLLHPVPALLVVQNVGSTVQKSVLL